MLANGTPNITTFRARQVTFDPADEPVVTRPRRLSGKRTGFVVAGILVILGLLLFWQQTVTPWWTSVQDQWNYGTARVTQMDADVGHGGTSHFLAEYYNNEIVVIEMSLTNPNDFHTYTLTGMVSATDTPVILLSLADVNHDGRPDLVIQVKGSSFTTTLYNNGTTFTESER
jgi:hypothetical protein